MIMAFLREYSGFDGNQTIRIVPPDCYTMLQGGTRLKWRSTTAALYLSSLPKANVANPYALHITATGLQTCVLSAVYSCYLAKLVFFYSGSLYSTS